MVLIDSLNVLRGAWVDVIELHNSLQGFHLRLVDPQVLLVSIAFPAYQVLKFPSEHAAVQDGLHFVFLIAFIINEHWSGRVLELHPEMGSLEAPSSLTTLNTWWRWDMDWGS